MTPSTVVKPSSGSQSPQEPDAALPLLNLPNFAGELLAWESFRDRFTSLLHKSIKLSKVRKLEYLMSCLTGDAAKMLARTAITDGNYDGAWASLEKRFGNRRVLSAAHMRRLINVPSATKDTQSEIKRLLNEFRQTQEAFKALAKPVKEWDEWFLFLMVEKLDNTTRLAWEVSLTDPLAIPLYETLEAFLENRVHALSSAQTAETIPSPKPLTSTRSAGKPVSRTTMAVKVDDSRKTKNNRQCPLCAGGHSLGSWHQLQTCTSNFRYWVCGDTHHTPRGPKIIAPSRQCQRALPTP
ncbi:uncharacterized protein LOC128896572 [Hylaeus anthracinus]|uniref:uncharacterized protein LOC128896572 n=1 Tax=Hylaeus anthracinus TaxID=313031 RepID=UPI0023BA2775|nr:uncharacterized protein LOC128896572 [Hylaeus anthracinus]